MAAAAAAETAPEKAPKEEMESTPVAMKEYETYDCINDPPRPPYRWRKQEFERPPRLEEIKLCDRCPNGGDIISVMPGHASCGCGHSLAHWDTWTKHDRQLMHEWQTPQGHHPRTPPK